MKTATIDGPYRYRLGRRLEVDSQPVGFVMLNPSTADSDHDDPTIRRCIRFAFDWGRSAYVKEWGRSTVAPGNSGIVVGNVYAYRATKPAELWRAQRNGVDIVGPFNDAHLRNIAKECSIVVCAWGAGGGARGFQVAAMLQLWGAQLVNLGLCKNGHPRHPLYIRADSEPESWDGVVAAEDAFGSGPVDR